VRALSVLAPGISAQAAPIPFCFKAYHYRPAGCTWTV
jgi:hypothetical protein